MAKAANNAGLSPAMISVVKSGYDESKLYTDSTNRHDHSKKVYVEIPPPVKVMILQALDGNPGYNNSIQAFIRDAIVHRLAYHERNPGSAIDPLQMKLHLMRMEMNAFEEIGEQIRTHLSQFDRIVEECRNMEEWSLMNLFIDHLQDMLDTMEMSPGHRRMIEEAVEDAETTMRDSKLAVRRRRR